LGLDSGELIWEGRIPAPLRSPPSVAEGRVLLRTADNQLFALDGNDGAVLWRHAGFFEPTGFLGGAPPAVAAGTAVVAYSSGEVFALQLADGRPLWSETVQRPRRTLAIDAIVDVSGAPVIDAERVYVAGQGGETAAIELLRGIRAWDAPLSSPQMPWIAGDFLFLVTDRGDLVCLLRQGGRIRWVTRLGEVRAPGSVAGAVIWAGPILVGGRLLLASTTGQLISVLPETGEIVATTRLPGPAARPPVAAGGRVFVLTDRAQLVALG
jgi:outer membrane protein assembly factor BamB